MDATLESIVGSMTTERIGEFLRDAVSTFGGMWDAEQIVTEVVPMAEHHITPGRHARVLVALYPECRLLVQLDDEQTGTTIQEWEYLAPLP